MTIDEITTICIFLFLFFLFALQLNNVRFTPAFAQLGGSNSENLDLKGIWERLDAYPQEDLVYINQEGNAITATFEPMGTCWEDPYTRIEGTEFAPHKLEFTGNLVGNTIQGEIAMCYPEERAFELMDLTLTVSPDGRTLNGYMIDTDGQQYSQQYVFVSPIPLTSIEINTDRPVYNLKEPVEISGQVIDMVNGESDVFIEVLTL